MNGSGLPNSLNDESTDCVKSVDRIEFSPKLGRSASSVTRAGTQDPSGLKARIAALERICSNQNDEILLHRAELTSLRSGRDESDILYQGYLAEMRKAMSTDFQRLRDDFTRLVEAQHEEQSKLLSQLNVLRVEKSMLHKQLTALQRRVYDIDDEIGKD